MAEMMFYEKLAVLDPKVHEGWRLKEGMGFAFARKTNSLPVLGIEFAEVARDCPITFVKGPDGKFTPIVVLGLRDNENLMVNADGSWEARYVPAFVRRYPFLPAEVGPGEMALCIDETCPAFNKEEGELLFEGEKPGAMLQNGINLLREYHQQADRTAEFCVRLAELNLFVESNAAVQAADGQSFSLGGLYMIDEKALQALDKDAVHALFSTGELGLIYAHLLSLGNFNRLLSRLNKVGA